MSGFICLALDCGKVDKIRTDEGGFKRFHPLTNECSLIV